MTRIVVRSLFALALIASIGSGQARAAAIPSGSTLTAWAAATRGTATAYDSINHVYLVVGTYGTLRGRFVSPNGSPIGNPFVIQTSGNFTHFPRVAFSRDADGGAGGFLVTWHESDLPGGLTSTHARMVSWGKAGAYGSDTQLQAEGSWWEGGAAVAYSTGSHEFLVAWRKIGTYGIRAIRVDNNAAAKDVIFTISKTGQFEDNPSIAYNPNRDQFLVSYSGYNMTGNFAFVDCRLVQAGANTILGAAASRVGTAAGTYITDTVYNPVTDQFFVAWFDGNSEGRLVSADGTPLGNVITLSTRWKANDGLSVAYNGRSQTYFMIAASPCCYDDGGVEIAGSTGVPIPNSETVVTNSGATGNFYPRISASTDDPTWLVSTAHGFTSTMVQLVSGTAVGPPPPPPSQPMLHLDLPGAGVLQQPFVTVGWGFDKSASSGNGADVVHVWALRSGGGSYFVGAAPITVSRPDVSAAFGSQFSNAGWGLTVTGLPGGSYQLVAYLHDTVTGTFSLSAAVPITIADPITTIDLPTANATTPTATFLLGGWSIDRGAASGTGVDAIHVWAYPTSGGPAQWVGAASYGSARSDVGAAFGSQFTNSGYNLFVTLSGGTYDLVVYSHSTVTGSFNTASVVRVTVADPIMSIDVPTGSIVMPALGFLLGGWSIDRASGSGTGIDAVHVWAYPTSGGPAQWVGAAIYGSPRADVAAMFGAQFTNAGYNIVVTLPAGTYDLMAYSHSTVSGLFSTARVVRVTVQ